MTDADDYWYATKPAPTLVRRQGLSLEARGAASTYEMQMHMRDGGSIPDERSDKGLAWHMTTLGVRNRRTVLRLVGELIECGELVRLGDGRLTSKDVQKEIARRAKRRAKAEGEGGGGQGNGGGQEPAPRQLVLIEGGKSPQAPVDKPVDGPVEEMGTENESVGNRDSKTRFETIAGRITQRNQRNGRLIIEIEKIHEAVVAGTRFRARGAPWAARPP